MNISLTGRNALVTGGSKGLGLAMATRFAASGANVVIAARGREALDKALDAVQATSTGEVFGVSGDVGTADGCSHIYREATKAFDRIDILINNAGSRRLMPLESLTDEILQADLELKLFAAVRLIRLAWPQMKERKWGRIINVLNIGAKAPARATAPTSISRAAGLALTKILAGEGAPDNILVNALLVGFIETDQYARTAEETGIPLADLIRERAKNIPLGRAGRAEEFANLACFLASDAASFITGTAINVDGGASPVV